MEENKTKKKLVTYAGYVVLVAAGPLFFALTNPQSLPLPLLVLPFLWMFTALFIGSWLLLSRIKSIRRKQAVLVSGVVACVPVLLAVFQSIHQLTIRDVLLSMGLVILAAIYMLRADFIK